MKNATFIFFCLFLNTALCMAQDSISVRLVAVGKYEISPKKDLYELPVTLYFNTNSFKNKKISFYSDKEAGKEILSGKFNSEINKSGTSDFYVIKLKEDSTISLKDNEINIKNDFYIRIESNNVIGPIKFIPKVIVIPELKSELTNDYIAGSIFADALKLQELSSIILNTKSTQNESNFFNKILAFYDIKNDTDFIGNTYLSATLRTAYNKGAQSGKDFKGIFAAATSSVGGMDVTNIADGFAKFIVKRTKQELSISFFSKFKADLESYPDIKSVFPQTYRALSAIDKEIYMYQAYIQTLRESFEKDLASLPSNLPSIMDNHKEYFDSMPDLKATLSSGFYIAQAIQDKQHPGNIIENFPVGELDNVKDPNIKPAFQTLMLLSASLKSFNGVDNYWLQPNEIRKLIAKDNEVLLKIYLGLMEQKAKINAIIFFDPADKTSANKGKPLCEIIDKSFNEINALPQYRMYLKNLSAKVQLLDTKIASLNKTSNDSIRFENYYSVVSGTIGLMEYLTQVENLPLFPKGFHIQESTSSYFDIAQSASDIVIDVSRRNYSSAVVNGVYLYDVTFNKKSIETYLKDNSLKSINDTIHKYKDVSNSLFRYGSFMATVSQAKTSDDIEAAIEAVALPTGSARIKRQSPFNISLNAYAGIFIGYEDIKGMESSFKINTFGISAPIGVAISYGSHKFLPIPWKSDGGWSYSAFISLVDIGAVASFRFQNTDSIAQIPTIKLQDIFSPGLFLSVGIPKCPLSINLGAQVGPNLRNVYVEDTKNPGQYINTYQENIYVRFSASIVVDLPLLNLYTKTK